MNEAIAKEINFMTSLGWKERVKIASYKLAIFIRIYSF